MQKHWPPCGFEVFLEVQIIQSYHFGFELWKKAVNCKRIKILYVNLSCFTMVTVWNFFWEIRLQCLVTFKKITAWGVGFISCQANPCIDFFKNQIHIWSFLSVCRYGFPSFRTEQRTLTWQIGSYFKLVPIFQNVWKVWAFGYCSYILNFGFDRLFKFLDYLKLQENKLI